MQPYRFAIIPQNGENSMVVNAGPASKRATQKDKELPDTPMAYIRNGAKGMPNEKLRCSRHCDSQISKTDLFQWVVPS